MAGSLPGVVLLSEAAVGGSTAAVARGGHGGRAYGLWGGWWKEDSKYATVSSAPPL